MSERLITQMSNNRRYRSVGDENEEAALRAELAAATSATKNSDDSLELQSRDHVMMIEQLQSEMNTITAEIEISKNSINRLQSQYEKSKKSNVKLNANIVELKTAFFSAVEVLTHLKGGLKDVSEENFQLRKEMEKITALKPEYEKAAQEHTNRVHELAAQSERLTKSSAELTMQEEQRKNELEALVTRHEREKSEISNETKDLLEEKRALITKVGELNDTTEDLKKKLQLSVQDKQRLEERISDLSSSCEQLKTEKTAIEEEKTSLRKEVQTLTKDSESKIGQLQNQLSELTNSNEVMSKQIETLELDSVVTKEQLDQLKRSSDEAAVIRKTNEKLNYQLADLKNSLNDQNTRNATLEEENRTVIKQLEDAVQELKKVKSERKSIGELEKRLEELTLSNATFVKNEQSFVNERRAFEERVEQLSCDMQKSEISNRLLNDQVSELQLGKESSRREIKELHEDLQKKSNELEVAERYKNENCNLENQVM